MRTFDLARYINKTYKLFYHRQRRVFRLELPEKLVLGLLHRCGIEKCDKVVARIVYVWDTGEIVLRLECAY